MKIQNNRTKTYLVVGLSLVAILVASSSLGAVFAQVTPPNNTSSLDVQLQDAKEKIGSWIRSQSTNQNSTLPANIANVPLVLTYVDGRTNELVIGISDKAPLSKTTYENLIRPLVGDIPLRIEFGHILPLGCVTDYNSHCTPIVGGINVQTVKPDGTLNFATSITLPTTDSQGRKGFIMAGHGVNNGIVGGCGAVTYNGNPIQMDQGGVIVGKVVTNPTTPRKSDSAFVQITDSTELQNFVANKIYKTSIQNYNVVSKVPSSQIPYQTPVNIMGINGPKSGYVVSNGAIIAYDAQAGCGTLNYMGASMSPAPQGGDSGAPVFSTSDSSGNVSFYGIASAIWVGVDSNVLLFSPWESIQADLGVN